MVHLADFSSYFIVERGGGGKTGHIAFLFLQIVAVCAAKSW